MLILRGSVLVRINTLRVYKYSQTFDYKTTPMAVPRSISLEPDHVRRVHLYAWKYTLRHTLYDIKTEWFSCDGKYAPPPPPPRRAHALACKTCFRPVLTRPVSPRNVFVLFIRAVGRLRFVRVGGPTNVSPGE